MEISIVFEPAVFVYCNYKFDFTEEQTIEFLTNYVDWYAKYNDYLFNNELEQIHLVLNEDENDADIDMLFKYESLDYEIKGSEFSDYFYVISLDDFN